MATADDLPPQGETVELPSRPGSLLRLQRFSLRVVEGSDAGRTYACSGDRTLVGTHESAQLVLTDPAVSRFHCEVLTTGGPVVVRDLGSRNGLYVDGVRVIEAHLHGGALLTVGQTRIAFSLDDEPLDVPVSGHDRFGVMVGRSLAIRHVFSLLERAAASSVTVLLGGETGTGKEAAAESLHEESARREGPFIVVDCGAIPPTLLESELFGHEKGAFTGAVNTRIGAFEAADGGTIFLDEVGELSPDLQPKLLRALERREIKRVGGAKYAPVDARVVAATNRSLRAEVNAHRFRSDLYYRLAVVEIVLPALRERREDIPLLVESILQHMGLSHGPEAELVRRPEFQAALLAHAWPGNVRELRNYVERSIALAEQTPLEAWGEAAPAGVPAVDVSQPLRRARERCVAAFEKEYLTAILARHDGNVTAAARAAGVDRAHFYRLLWEHGLK